MIRNVLLAGCLLIISTGHIFADTKVEIEGRYWITDLESDIKTTINEIVGTDIDLKEDLGISDEDIPEARITLKITKNNKLRAAYTQIQYSGDKNIERTITFDGNSYTVGTPVESNLDVKYLRLGWLWQFINIADETIKLGPMFEIKGLSADAALNAPQLGLSASETFTGAFPTFGGGLDINPHKKINIFAEISGISLGNYGHFFDAEAGIKLIPIKNFTIAAGYRLFDLKIEDDPDYAKIKIKGPFLSGSFRF
jgi:hypothetical protein